jgi:hypothetical protein
MASTAELIFRIRPEGSADFKSTMAQVRSELTQSAKTQETVAKGELSTRQQLAAAASLQRQRSAALIGEWKRTERAAADLARGVGPVKDNLQNITNIMQALGSSSAALQGPMGGVASRLRALGAIASEAGQGVTLLSLGLGGLIAVVALATTVGPVLLTKQFIELTQSVAEFQGKMFDLSQQTGVSVETLSALEITARTTGSSIDQITASLGIFQKHLEEAHDPTSKQAALLETLGIQTNNTEEALRQAFTVLSQMPEGFRQTATALELFGRGGKAILAILKETHGDLDGAIKRFREMGILISGDTARAADEFNDQMALLEFQIRAVTASLVSDAMPQIKRAFKEASRLINENKDSIKILGEAVGVFVQANIHGVLLPALNTTAAALQELTDLWTGLKIAALLAVGESTRAAQEMADRYYQSVHKTAAVPTTPQTVTTELPLTPSKVIAVQQAQLAGLKQLAAEEARIAQDRIAKAQVAFRKGQITRQQESEDIISALKQQHKARVDAINAEIADKERQQKARTDDVVEQRKIGVEIEKLRQELRNADSELERKTTEEQVSAQEARNEAFITHIKNQLSLRQKANEAEVKLIEAQINAGEILALAGAEKIERIQNDSLEARREVIRQELKLEGLGNDQRKRILQQSSELEQEATIAKREQAERRKQITRDEIEVERDLLLAQVDAQLRLGSIRDNAQIASLRALAALRVKTEEETERVILAIRLAGIDREAEFLRIRREAAQVDIKGRIEAAEAEQKAAASAKVSSNITDPTERARAELQLQKERVAATERLIETIKKANKDQTDLDRALTQALAINKAERQALSDQGARDIEEGRQKDIDNRRRYAAEIKAIDLDIRRGELEQRRRDLEQIAQREGLNAKTIALFRKLTLDEEAEHHRRVIGELNAQQAQAHAVDVGGKNRLEIEQKYNQLREQENERFQKRNVEINAPGGADVSGPPPRSAVDQLFDAINKNLSGTTQTAALAGLEALTTAFQGLGQAIGQVVEAWVLYGSAGTSVRKVTAQILAGVAQQAAVKAVFELAEGFAALALAFFGMHNAVPSAAAHFAAAAIYGSIAGIAAVAGRAVAGDAFKQQSSTTGSGSSSRGRSSDRSRGPEVIDVNRRVGSSGASYQPIVYVTIKGEATEGFRYMVEKAAVESVRFNGPMRRIQTGEEV